jgi:hypothetical protein
MTYQDFDLLIERVAEGFRARVLGLAAAAPAPRASIPFAGSAQTLVQQGIPAVIAMQFEIADDVAST